MDRLTKHVATTLRAARQAKSMTQEELASKLDMATESISHFERAVTAPSLKTIAAIAAKLDIELVDLFLGLTEKRGLTPRRAENEAYLRRIARDLDDDALALVVRLAKATEAKK